MTWEIVETTVRHLHEIVDRITPDDTRELTAFGLKPITAMINNYKKAAYRKTLLVDGRVVAVWGVVGTLMAEKGAPYLLTTYEFTTLPLLKIVREYQKEVYCMRELFSYLENWLLADHYSAFRLLKIIGFSVSKPHHGPNGMLFRRISSV